MNWASENHLRFMLKNKGAESANPFFKFVRIKMWAAVRPWAAQTLQAGTTHYRCSTRRHLPKFAALVPSFNSRAHSYHFIQDEHTRHQIYKTSIRMSRMKRQITIKEIIIIQWKEWIACLTALKEKTCRDVGVHNLRRVDRHLKLALTKQFLVGALLVYIPVINNAANTSVNTVVSWWTECVNRLIKTVNEQNWLESIFFVWSGSRLVFVYHECTHIHPAKNKLASTNHCFPLPVLKRTATTFWKM